MRATFHRMDTARIKFEVGRACICNGPNPSPIQRRGLSLQAPASPDDVMMKSLASPNDDCDGGHIYPSLV